MIPDIHVVAADHPSLDGEIDRFLDDLRNEPRYFGRAWRDRRKPFPSVITAFRDRGGFRLAALECGRVVGMARVDGGGELTVAVVADRRGHGIGELLGRAAVERAASLHYARLVARTSGRSGAIHRIGSALGCIVVDRGGGNTELFLDLDVVHRTA